MAPHSRTLAWKIPWTEEPGVYIKYHYGYGLHFIWTQGKQDSRQKRAVSQTSLVQVIRGGCLNSHFRG